MIAPATPQVPRPRRESDSGRPLRQRADAAPVGAAGLSDTAGPGLGNVRVSGDASTARTSRGHQPSRAPATAPSEAPRTRAGGYQTARWGLPLAVLVVGMFMSVLDTSIVNVAIPRMQKQFGASTDDIQWVTTAYTLCLGVVVPASAWLGDRLGLRRLYVLSLALFAGFSALCGMADSLGMMVAFRILQAIPAGLIPVTCLTVLYRMVPPQRLGRAMGLYGFGIVVAPGVGPTLGGYLVEYVNWRLIFYINVPIGILGAVAALFVLPRFPPAPGRRFDLPGFLCIAAGLFALLLAISEGQDWGWTGYRVLILTASGTNLLALFVIIERQAYSPLLNVEVFRSWQFVNSLLLIAILSIGLFSVLFYVPLFLQNGQDLTPWHTGLTVLPQALVMTVMMPLAGRIYDRIGPRVPAAFGLALMGIGTLLLTGINRSMTRPELIEWMMIRAAGIGLAMMPIMTGGLSTLPKSAVNSGSAFNTLVQRVTAAIGLSALTALATQLQAQLLADRSALLTSTGPDVDPRVLAMEKGGPGGLVALWQQLQIEIQAQSYSDVFLISGVCSLGGVVLALFLRHGKPARSDTPGQQA